MRSKGIWLVGTDEGVHRSIYLGARPFSALNVMRRILKTILYFMGSQWRAARTGVIWSDFLVLETSRAAVFWILCSLEIEHSGKPYSILLQESSREVTKAWISFSQSSCDRYF